MPPSWQKDIQAHIQKLPLRTHEKWRRVTSVLLERLAENDFIDYPLHYDLLISNNTLHHEDRNILRILCKLNVCNITGGFDPFSKETTDIINNADIIHEPGTRVFAYQERLNFVLDHLKRPQLPSDPLIGNVFKINGITLDLKKCTLKYRNEVSVSPNHKPIQLLALLMERSPNLVRNTEIGQSLGLKSYHEGCLDRSEHLKKDIQAIRRDLGTMLKKVGFPKTSLTKIIIAQANAGYQMTRS